mmetsp:Transcript_22662/g.53576  ORF Transcript_22662/g.53576 Transcript_22662/m.53576 type:complete len:222 (-) Transcript_22662:137-802(-)
MLPLTLLLLCARSPRSLITTPLSCPHLLLLLLPPWRLHVRPRHPLALCGPRSLRALLRPLGGEPFHPPPAPDRWRRRRRSRRSRPRMRKSWQRRGSCRRFRKSSCRQPSHRSSRGSSRPRSHVQRWPLALPPTPQQPRVPQQRLGGHQGQPTEVEGQEDSHRSRSRTKRLLSPSPSPSPSSPDSLDSSSPDSPDSRSSSSGGGCRSALRRTFRRRPTPSCR